jgi:hypothetical protein
MGTTSVVARRACAVLIAIGALLAGPAVASASDRTLCTAAKSAHERFFRTTAQFTQAFTSKNRDVAAQKVVQMEADVDRYRSRVIAQRGSTRRGRQLRSALLEMVAGLKRGVNRFADANDRAEAGGSGAVERFTDGQMVMARAVSRATPAIQRSGCRIRTPTPAPAG